MNKVEKALLLASALKFAEDSDDIDYENTKVRLATKYATEAKELIEALDAWETSPEKAQKAFENIVDYIFQEI